MDSVNAVLSEDQGAGLQTLAIAMIVLPTVSLSLRSWARFLAPPQLRFGWDDWFAVCAWVCCMCECAFMLKAVQLGLGKHIEALRSTAHYEYMLKMLYAARIIFNLGIVFTKFSVLIWYRRLFTSTPRAYKVTYWTTFVLTTIFLLYKLPAQLLVCVPIKKFWHPEAPGRCVNEMTNFGLLLPGLLLDVITDLLILLLPMPIVWKLKIAAGPKTALIFAFVCGYVTWITSIGRMGAYIKLQSQTHDPDFFWYQIPVLSWSLTELGISVFSVCLPNWFCLINRAHHHGLLALFTKRDFTVRNPRSDPNLRTDSPYGNRLTPSGGQDRTKDAIPPLHLPQSPNKIQIFEVFDIKEGSLSEYDDLEVDTRIEKYGHET